jgi:hypothetical protein
MTDPVLPVLPTVPHPETATPASLSPTGLAKFVTWLVGLVVSAFKSLFGGALPAAKWATHWGLTLTGTKSMWDGVLVLARNPTALSVAGVVALGGYLLGHHEADRAWAPTETRLKATALTNLKLTQENDLLKSRPVPVCTPAAAPAPAKAPPKKRRTI